MRLENPATSSPSSRYEPAVGVHGQTEHLDIGQICEDPPAGLDAVHSGHRDVEDDHVRLPLAGELLGVVAIARAAHHLQVGLLFQKGLETLAEYLVVIDQ